MSLINPFLNSLMQEVETLAKRGDYVQVQLINIKSFVNVMVIKSQGAVIGCN